MYSLPTLGLLALSISFAVAAGDDITAELQRQKEVDEDVGNELQKQKNIISSLTRQIMMQQLMYEESNRASWDSGIKSVRGSISGSRPYFAETHTDLSSVFAIHDHSQKMRTIGLGEIVVKLNGVEFRTIMIMPSKCHTRLARSTKLYRISHSLKYLHQFSLRKPCKNKQMK